MVEVTCLSGHELDRAFGSVFAHMHRRQQARSLNATLAWTLPIVASNVEQATK